MTTADWAIEIERAARLLDGVTRRTPVLRSRDLDRELGATVLSKDEGRQLTGSFKVRGAWNALTARPPDSLRAGVITYSSGNFGRALAYAAQRRGLRCLVFAPRDAPSEKLDAIRRAGASVRLYDPGSDDRQRLAERDAVARGMALIRPFDDKDVIAGQGTVARKLVRQAPELGILIAPVSGGGLLAGSALAARASGHHIQVIGVEPATMPRASLSLRADARATVPARPTIADALRVPTLGALTFPVIQQYVDAVVTVSDDELACAITLTHRHLGAHCEPAGAAGIAALLAGRIDTHGKRIGVILSGSNISRRRFAELVHVTEPAPAEQRG
jgi:threo-3-hydroxy-L-aspartate ammonia-lyase